MQDGRGHQEIHYLPIRCDRAVKLGTNSGQNNA
nr:MAG TPA: hypothetical protein [Caudoviricetes sp.]